MTAKSWTRPFARWWGRPDGAETPKAPAARGVFAPDTAPTGAAVGIDDALVAELQPHFLHWLLGLTPSEKPVEPVPADADVRALPGLLDALTVTEAQCAQLLPRAAQVVPQLMKAMRDERYSAVDVAERISKDVVLTTEVIRLANSVHRAGQQPIVDIAHAVTAVGSDGLRRAIAKIVLRPVFESRSAPLSISAAPHVWTDAERKARLCAALAPAHGVDPLDGYLAGLLHNTGWTALLRALDMLRPPPKGALLLDAELGGELRLRRDRLFGRLVAPWQVSAPLTAFAEEVAARGLGASTAPLAEVLRTAENLATRHALQRSHDLPGGAEALGVGQPAAVQECLATLDGP